MSPPKCPKLSFSTNGKITIHGLSIFRGNYNVCTKQEEYLRPRKNMVIERIDEGAQIIIAVSTPHYDLIFIRIIGVEATVITYPAPINRPDPCGKRFEKRKVFFTFKIDDGPGASTSTRLCPQARQKTLDSICEKLAEPEPAYDIDRPIITIRSHEYRS